MESPPDSEISCMTFLVNCCLVATGHEDGSIRLWNMEINSSVTLRCEDQHKHKNSISCILGAYHIDSEFLICGSYDGKISIWEISEKKSTNSNTMLSSTIFPQLKMVIDNTKIPEKGERKHYRGDFEEEKTSLLGSEVLCLQFYADTPAAMSPNSSIKFDNISGGEETQQRGHGYVIVGGSDKRVNIWNIRTYDHVAQLRGHKDSITCMSIDQNFLFTGSDDTTIGIWELRNNYNVGFLAGHKESIQDVIVMKEAGFLLSCAYDKTIIVWKYEEKREIMRYLRQEELRCMDYLSSMRMLFVGTNQKSILTINIEEILSMNGYKGSGVGSSFLDESIAFRGSEIDQSFRKRLQIGGGMDGEPFVE